MSKRKYGLWSEEDLISAVRDYKTGKYGLNACSRLYKVPKATIRRHMNDAHVSVKSFGRRPVFSEEMEQIVSEHILKLEERFFGLTINEIRRLVYDIAEKHNLPNNFNKNKKIVGKKWFYSFMKRNPHIAVLKSDTGPSKGFNRKKFNQFFDLLEKLVKEHTFTADSIFNVDESVFTTAQKNMPRKGNNTNREWDVNTTMICGVNAVGLYIPPMIIFENNKLLDDSPSTVNNIIIKNSDTGYINSELFIQWLKHFQNHVNCNINNKVLLLLDSNTTRCKTLEAWDFARDNGIVLLQLPGNITNRVRPLEVEFFGLIQTYFSQAQEGFLHSILHKEEKIYQSQILKLLHEAYVKAATVDIAKSAFLSTGIWPINRHVFADAKFAPDDEPQTTETICEISSDDEDEVDASKYLKLSMELVKQE